MTDGHDTFLLALYLMCVMETPCGRTEVFKTPSKGGALILIAHQRLPLQPTRKEHDGWRKQLCYMRRRLRASTDNSRAAYTPGHWMRPTDLNFTWIPRSHSRDVRVRLHASGEPNPDI